jgi:hypothetical protein
MNEIKRPALFIATPMYGGMCTGSYLTGVMQLPMTLASKSMLMYYNHIMNESLITRARNRCAYEFLHTDATHLMFIDADIGFNAQDIVSMVECDLDIVCGLYPKKEIHWGRVTGAVQNGVPPEELQNHTGTFVVNLVGDKEVQIENNKTFEIDNGGTGFMLIKRNVFEALASHVPKYKNDMYLATEVVSKDMFIDEFFATSIDDDSGRLLSEDYHFCKLARKHGFKVHAAPWVRLSHTGTYVFSGALQGVA